jgi:tRNA G18 (ribose-2'-O)-methylase SpoU
MPRVLIRTLDDARIVAYRDLKQRTLLRRSGLFIAEGPRVVRRLVESNFEVESVLVSDRREATYAELLPSNVAIYVMPQELAEQLVGFNFHTGILACGRRKANPELSALVSARAERSVVVACSRVNDPENVGAIVRLCAAFGVHGLLLDDGCSDPFSRRVLRVSMGNALALPIRGCRDLTADLLGLRDEWNFRLAATVARGTAEPLESAPRPERLVLVFGNEAEGLDQRLVDLCHLRITVPMPGAADSLNVAVAAGIILYHFRRPA